MNRLVVSDQTWTLVQEHLLPDRMEHMCFVLVEHIARGADNVFLERELRLIEDDDLENGGERYGLSLKLDALIETMNRARELNCVLFEMHSHPFSDQEVDFSWIDMEGQKEIVAYLADVLPARPYGALVLGQGAILGQIWFPGEDRAVLLDEIRAVGPVVRSFGTHGRARSEEGSFQEGKVESAYDRQVLALGAEGQRRVEKAVVGIVGLGGLGSIIAQQLSHLGVRSFVFVDDDRVERSNLNRLVGATARDVGHLKAELAARQIRDINRAANPLAVPMNVRSSEALARLVECDFVFGCVDTDSGRLILNEVANAYLIPYIDCGVGIEASDGRIREAGGRVVVWVPGRPCLLCAGEINPRIAAEELESQEEQRFRKEYGYVVGAHVSEPAVISLNGTVASLAVTEFLALATGFRRAQHYVFYDMIEQRVVSRAVKRDEKCPACGVAGLGDRAGVSRYARVGLPDDLPRPV
jgi:molybdopterin/thiamine biosynthesis adenylyltransferase